MKQLAGVALRKSNSRFFAVKPLFATKEKTGIAEVLQNACILQKVLL